MNFDHTDKVKTLLESMEAMATQILQQQETA